nr:PREDICTED: uncharacterized protein LOC103979732 [Musa acuminata subsp. malaccensis]
MTDRWNMFWFHLHKVLCVLLMIYVISNECKSINLEGWILVKGWLCWNSGREWSLIHLGHCRIGIPETTTRANGPVFVASMEISKRMQKCHPTIDRLIDHSCTTIVLKHVIAFIFFQPFAKIYCASN